MSWPTGSCCTYGSTCKEGLPCADGYSLAWQPSFWLETGRIPLWPSSGNAPKRRRGRRLNATVRNEPDRRPRRANRSRGLGGNPTTGAEENVLGYPGTRYFGEHIFVHEFAHAIHRAVRDVDPGMAQEIADAYDAAMAAGRYQYEDGWRHYATTNANEYWAEGVQWWFFSNYGECFAGDVTVESPDEFGAYDPVLSELIGRVFDTHRIPMDVFHAKRIRQVTCPVG